MAGKRVLKQLHAIVDGRTTACCLLAHGQVQEVDQPYVTLQGKFMEPPFHLHCRSISVPYIEEFGDEARQEAQTEMERRGPDFMVKAQTQRIPVPETSGELRPVAAERADVEDPKSKLERLMRQDMEYVAQIREIRNEYPLSEEGKARLKEIKQLRDELDAEVESVRWGVLDASGEGPLVEFPKVPNLEPTDETVREFKRLQYELEQEELEGFQREAFQSYQGEGFRSIQGALYSGNEDLWSDYVRDAVEGIDASFAPLRERVTVYRGMTNLDEFQPGDVIETNGYTSCTLDSVIAQECSRSAGRVVGPLRVDRAADYEVLEIDLEPGDEVFFTPNAQEREVMLPRGVTLKIESREVREIDGREVKVLVARLDRPGSAATDRPSASSVRSQLPSPDGTARVVPVPESVRAAVERGLGDRPSLRFGETDPAADAFFEAMGLDGLPTVVPDGQVREIAERGPVGELWRSVQTVEHADQFREGDLFVGDGVYGSGTYTVEGTEQEFREYVEDVFQQREGVLHMALDPDAKVLSLSRSELRRLQAEWEEAAGDDPVMQLITNDPSMIAALNGYDAVRVERDGPDFIVVIDRSKVSVGEARAAESQPPARVSMSDVLKVESDQPDRLAAALSQLSELSLPEGVPEILVDHSKRRQGEGADGWFSPATGDVRVMSGQLGAADTLVHEVGHWLDHYVFGAGAGYGFAERRTPAMQELLDEMMKTPEYQKQFEASPDYGATPIELWARAFAQWMKEERGESFGDEVYTRAQVRNGYQWDEASFERLRPLVRAVLDEAGLLDGVDKREGLEPPSDDELETTILGKLIQNGVGGRGPEAIEKMLTQRKGMWADNPSAFKGWLKNYVSDDELIDRYVRMVTS